MTIKQLRNHLKDVMEKEGIKQTDIAGRLGVYSSAISQALNADGYRFVDLTLRIAKDVTGKTVVNTFVFQDQESEVSS